MDGEPSDTAIKVRVSTWQQLNSMKLPGKTFDDVIDFLIKHHKKTKAE